MHKITAFFGGSREENNMAARENAAINIKRISIGAAGALLIHLSMIIIYMSSEYTYPHEVIWSRYVITTHGVALLIMAAALAVSLILRRREKQGVAAYVLQYSVICIVMANGITSAAIDQLVTTNITPYMIVSAAIGIVFLIRPLYSFIIFTASYIGFFFSIALGAHPLGILLSNRTDGLVITAIGFLISVFMWRYNLLNLRQRRCIEEQQKKLAEIAYADPLTGLLNRRRFDDIIKSEIADASSRERESSLIMLDLDNFKNINDSFGHPAGDSVLVQLGALLSQNIRGTDMACRVGGEEFIILLPATPLGEAEAVAERLRSLIEEYTFLIAGEPVRMTASFGVSRLDYSLDPTLVSQYSIVDKALYLAKCRGRNRVVAN